MRSSRYIVDVIGTQIQYQWLPEIQGALDALRFPLILGY